MENLEIKKVEQDAETSTIRSRAPELVSFAGALEIKDETGAKAAIEKLAVISADLKTVDARRRFFVDPYNMFVKRLNEFFKATTLQLQDADMQIRRKLSTWNDQQERIAEAAKAKVMEDLEKGKIKDTKKSTAVEKAVAKIENVHVPEKTVRTEAATLSHRIVKKVVIENPSLLPREYLIPDEVKIRKVALAGIAIAGVKVVEEKTTSLRSNL